MKSGTSDSDNFFGVGESRLWQQPLRDHGLGNVIIPPNLPVSQPSTDWGRIMKELARDQAVVTTVPSKRTLKYKGVVFHIYVKDDVMEFFEDPKAITEDEMSMVFTAFPEVHCKIKSAWMDAWKDLQAAKAFDQSC